MNYKVKRLDKYSFKEVFDLYWKPLVAFCQHHTDNEEIAMDIVQDIFCSLWRRKDYLKIETSFEYYLFRAARIKISDYFRKKYKQLNHENQFAESYCEAANVTEEFIESKDLNSYLESTIQKLPERCRQVYQMSRGEGFTIPQIASLLSLSEKTVEAHLTKALRFLRSNLPA
ncbi:MAG: hypothetical protein K0S24_1773 [Sphingobacterium sp.]|jgi:RNA polymerase sigma-70 factor (ECF subfamily)|nr:hypothetical protein [Sphingobacterium sp.]